jgi:hypothetical protein
VRRAARRAVSRAEKYADPSIRNAAFSAFATFQTLRPGSMIADAEDASLTAVHLILAMESPF